MIVYIVLLLVGVCTIKYDDEVKTEAERGYKRSYFKCGMNKGWGGGCFYRITFSGELLGKFSK